MNPFLSWSIFATTALAIYSLIYGVPFRSRQIHDPPTSKHIESQNLKAKIKRPNKQNVANRAPITKSTKAVEPITTKQESSVMTKSTSTGSETSKSEQLASQKSKKRAKAKKSETLSVNKPHVESWYKPDQSPAPVESDPVANVMNGFASHLSTSLIGVDDLGRLPLQLGCKIELPSLRMCMPRVNLMRILRLLLLQSFNGNSGVSKSLTKTCWKMIQPTWLGR